jgi:16S rRNA (uracil1498-N3)-methyltransferase
MARRRFFVEQVHRGEALLEGEDAEHLTRVLRVENGQRFEISDNHGVYLAQVVEARRQRVRFAVVEPLPVLPAPVAVTLYAALIKFDRFEWLVEKATELGVDRITPVHTERSEPGLERAAEKRLARWRRIGKEASQQARRARLPEVSAAVAFPEALAADEPWRYLLDEAEGTAPLCSLLPEKRAGGDRVALLVGPEGGWTSRERERAREGGWLAASLAPEVLRAETAALTALALVRHAWWSAAGFSRTGTLH